MSLAFVFYQVWNPTKDWSERQKRLITIAWATLFVLSTFYQVWEITVTHCCRDIVKKKRRSHNYGDSAIYIVHWNNVNSNDTNFETCCFVSLASKCYLFHWTQCSMEHYIVVSIFSKLPVTDLLLAVAKNSEDRLCYCEARRYIFPVPSGKAKQRDDPCFPWKITQNKTHKKNTVHIGTILCFNI